MAAERSLEEESSVFLVFLAGVAYGALEGEAVGCDAAGESAAGPATVTAAAVGTDSEWAADGETSFVNETETTKAKTNVTA